MTGYGRAGFTIEGEPFFIEIRSLNHRFLDITLKIPERMGQVEARIKDEIKKRFLRGSVTISISTDYSAVSPMKLNLAAARAYLEAAEELKKELGVPGAVDVGLLLRQREIFYQDRSGGKPIDADSAWAPVGMGLNEALDQVQEWRAKEGASLEDDLKTRLKTLSEFLSSIEARIPEVLPAYRERLKAEMESLLKEKIDEGRIFLEAALFAQKTDVSEEITRIKSHFDMFRYYLGAPEPVGKRIDFLCQELFREVNTIASKANDSMLTQTVVELKWELERIREQAQNIE